MESHLIILNPMKFPLFIHWLNPVFYPTDSNISTSRPNGRRGTCHRVKEAPPTGPHGPRHHSVRRGVATEPGRKIRRSWEKWWISMVKNRDFIMENDGNMVEIMGIMVICWGCGKTKVFWTIWFMLIYDWKHIWSNIGIAICLISMFYSKAIFEQGCSNTFRE